LVQPVQLFESTMQIDSTALNVVFFLAVPVLIAPAKTTHYGC
jgi:hypothetical protein